MEQTTNTFTKGLLMDINPLQQSNDTLTDALNATFVTMNGNEVVLQNDMGNAQVQDAYLPQGFVPVGMKEYGGIIYVASYNPITNQSQLGSFPSPQQRFYQNDNDNDFDIKSSDFFDDEYNLKTRKILKPIKDVIRSGDKFLLYFNEETTTNNSNTENNSNAENNSNNLFDKINKEDLFSNYYNVEGTKPKSPKNKYLTLSIGVLNSKNEFVDITSDLLRFTDVENNSVINSDVENNSVTDSESKTFGEFDSELYKFNYGYFVASCMTKDSGTELSSSDKELKEVRDLNKIKNINTYKNKLVGPLYGQLEFNAPIDFDYSISGEKNKDDEYNLEITSEFKYNCPDFNISTKLDKKDDNYSDLELYDKYIRIKKSDDWLDNDIFKLYFDLTSNNWNCTLTSIELKDHDYNDGVYSVKIIENYTITRNSNDSDENNFEYTIVPILKYIYPEGNTNELAEIKIKDLEQTGSIDLSKLNSGIMDLKRWQFYTDIDNNKTSIRMGFDSYPKKNQKFRDLKLKFYELDEKSNKDYILIEFNSTSNDNTIVITTNDGTFPIQYNNKKHELFFKESKYSVSYNENRASYINKLEYENELLKLYYYDNNSIPKNITVPANYYTKSEFNNYKSTLDQDLKEKSNLKRIYYISKDQEQIGFNGTFDFVVDWDESQTKISSKYSKKITITNSYVKSQLNTLKYNEVENEIKLTLTNENTYIKYIGINSENLTEEEIEELTNKLRYYKLQYINNIPRLYYYDYNKDNGEDVESGGEEYINGGYTIIDSDEETITNGGLSKQKLYQVDIEWAVYNNDVFEKQDSDTRWLLTTPLFNQCYSGINSQIFDFCNPSGIDQQESENPPEEKSMEYIIYEDLLKIKPELKQIGQNSSIINNNENEDDIYISKNADSIEDRSINLAVQHNFQFEINDVSDYYPEDIYKINSTYTVTNEINNAGFDCKMLSFTLKQGLNSTTSADRNAYNVGIYDSDDLKEKNVIYKYYALYVGSKNVGGGNGHTKIKIQEVGKDSTNNWGSFKDNDNYKAVAYNSRAGWDSADFITDYNHGADRPGYWYLKDILYMIYQKFDQNCDIARLYFFNNDQSVQHLDFVKSDYNSGWSIIFDNSFPSKIKYIESGTSTENNNIYYPKEITIIPNGSSNFNSSNYTLKIDNLPKKDNNTNIIKDIQVIRSKNSNPKSIFSIKNIDDYEINLKNINLTDLINEYINELKNKYSDRRNLNSLISKLYPNDISETSVYTSDRPLTNIRHDNGNIKAISGYIHNFNYKIYQSNDNQVSSTIYFSELPTVIIT